jgi:hypothetical protein
MGNKMSLELKEGRPCIEIGESLVRDFQVTYFSLHYLIEYKSTASTA